MTGPLANVHTFINGNVFIYSKYLLFVELTPDLELGSDESAVLFLLWFVVLGRLEHDLPVVFADDLLALLTDPSSDGSHLLMHYVADQFRPSDDPRSLRAWYYGSALAQNGLACFLGDRELARISGFSESIDPPETETLARVRQLAAAKARQQDGGARPRVSIVGYHRSVLGLGEDARCLFDCLCEAGIVAELVDASPQNLERYGELERYAAFEAPRPTASILIFCVPAIEMVWAISRLGLNRPEAPQYRIGYWPWESSAHPPAWDHVYQFVDEVWASTTFLRDVYRAGTGKPVLPMPLHVSVDAAAELTTSSGDVFTFLSVFDFNSRILRKNPFGTIAAFKAAFARERRDVRLLLKTLHASTRPGDHRDVLDAIADDDRIELRDGPMSRAALCSLIGGADAYVSLHRAEGFGRPIAEAMLLGTPVIATGWSGCSDFLDETTGYPVRSTIRPVRKGEYPYASGNWAEPDLAHAATLMQAVAADPGSGKTRLQAARALVQRTYGLKPVAAMLDARLVELERMVRGGTGPDPASFDHAAAR